MIPLSIACTSGIALAGVRSCQNHESAAGVVADVSPYAGRKLFALVDSGATVANVLVAPARKAQTGGPETLRPADVQPYQSMPLTADARIRVTSPIINDGITDYISGVPVSPQRFTDLLRQLHARLHPLADRAHMFDVWFDDKGRITRMQHYFSP